jgi:MFS family permease
MSHEPAYRSAFASAAYRRYFPGSVCSTLGSWTLRFLMGWSAWDLTGSATWVGAVAGLMLAPALLLSPLFGIVSDRINPRNGLLLTISLHAAVAGAAGLTSLAGHFNLPALLLLATCLGVATSAHTPIRLALVPTLVPRESLPSAIGYSATLFNTSRILGPALGAWLLTLGSSAAAYAIAAVLMLLALPFVVGIPGRQRRPGEAHEGGFFQQLMAGLHYTRAHREIRLVFGFVLINAMLGRAVIELLPALSGQLLAGDATTLATLTAAAGAGAVAGGLIVSRQSGRQERLFKLMRWSLTAGAFLVGSLAWQDDILVFAAIITLVSMITTVSGTTSQALAQLLVDEQYRGRVLSLWTMIAMGAPAAGALTLGLLADWLSFPIALLAFASAALVALVALRWRGGARLNHRALADSGP